MTGLHLRKRNFIALIAALILCFTAGLAHADCEQHDFGSGTMQVYIYSSGVSWNFTAEKDLRVTYLEVVSKLAGVSTLTIKISINDVVLGSWSQSVTRTYTYYTHTKDVDFSLNTGDTITYTISGGTLSTPGGGITGPNYIKLCEDHDDTPPTVSSTTPNSGATEVSTNSSVKAVFSEEMDSSTINNDTFAIYHQTGDTENQIDGQVTYENPAATFVPSDNLEENALYRAVITTGAADLAGNYLENEYSWTFSTSTVDNVPPEASSTFPENNSTNIPVDTVISVVFSEDMDPATITADNFTVEQAASDGGTGSYQEIIYFDWEEGADERNVRVSGSVSYSDKTASFVPDSSLSENQTYIATVTINVKDLAGNNLAADYTWNFTTGSTSGGNTSGGGDGGGGGGCYLSVFH